MHSDGPLPKTFDPVRVGRYGIWLLSLRSHNAAQRRIAFPTRVGHATFVHRFLRLILPWRIHEYPGATRFVSELCGIDRDYVRNLMKPGYADKLPLKHALRLAQYLEQHASECEALAREMRAYERNRRPVKKRR